VPSSSSPLLLRINEAPVIDVHIVQSSAPPGGMGDPGISAIAPAITSAIFAATGKRVRKLPVDTTAQTGALIGGRHARRRSKNQIVVIHRRPVPRWVSLTYAK
jgi:hypothetical protein